MTLAAVVSGLTSPDAVRCAGVPQELVSETPAWDDGVHSLYRHSSAALDLQKVPGAIHIPRGQSHMAEKSGTAVGQ